MSGGYRLRALWKAIVRDVLYKEWLYQKESRWNLSGREQMMSGTGRALNAL